MFKKGIDYDIELEQAVLGIILLEPHCFGGIQGLIMEDCFYVESHRAVFKAMETLWKNLGVLDIFTVARQLIKQGHTELGYTNNSGHVHWFLTLLTQKVTTSAHIEPWCLILRELAAKRLVMQLKYVDISPADDVIEKISEIQNKLRQVQEIKTVNDWVSLQKVAAQLEKKIINFDGQTGFIPTGCEEIDKINGGFTAKQFVVIGARPAVGKSAYMAKAVRMQAKKGYRVGIINLEMGNVDTLSRMISAESQVPYSVIERHLHKDINAKNQVLQALQSFKNNQIFFSDKAQVTALDIRAKCEKLKRDHKVDIIWIDYLQLIQGNQGNNKTRDNVVSEISRQIKLTAMDLDIPIVSLAQLNRQGADKQPELIHLRESGSIEQDADVVMFLHKPTSEDGRDCNNLREVLVRKWRNGNGSIDIEMGFDGERMDFYALTDDWSNPPAQQQNNFSQNNAPNFAYNTQSNTNTLPNTFEPVIEHPNRQYKAFDNINPVDNFQKGDDLPF